MPYYGFAAVVKAEHAARFVGMMAQELARDVTRLLKTINARADYVTADKKLTAVSIPSTTPGVTCYVIVRFINLPHAQWPEAYETDHRNSLWSGATTTVRLSTYESKLTPDVIMHLRQKLLGKVA